MKKKFAAGRAAASAMTCVLCLAACGATGSGNAKKTVSSEAVISSEVVSSEVAGSSAAADMESTAAAVVDVESVQEVADAESVQTVEDAIPDKDSLKAAIIGTWTDEKGNKAIFEAEGKSQLSFAETLTVYDIMADLSLQLTDRYGEAETPKFTADKDEALKSTKYYYVSGDTLILQKHELKKQ